MKLIRLFILLACLPLLSACPSKKVKPETNAHIRRLDSISKNLIKYVRHKDRRLPSGQIELVYVFQNKDQNKNVTIDWKVVYMDGAGFPMEETEWNSTVFPIGEDTTIRSNSLKQSVTTYVIVLREGKI